MLRPAASALLRLANRPLTTRGGFDAQAIDAVIALGAPVRPDGSLPPWVRERVQVSLELFETTAAQALVFTGGAVVGPCEAEAMAREATRMGADPSAIVVESDSRSTAENADRCAELLLPSYRRVIVVSQPFHLRRARWHFRRAGFDAEAAASPQSLQFRELARGFRWTAREYGAWLVTRARGA